MTKDRARVFVGLSGGVDSSVSAALLLSKGYDVTGVFIRTWVPDFLACNMEEERLDAMRVAAHLGIPFRTIDAEDSYREHVAEYMIEEYKKGRIPNPDVMCNRFVKFGTFLDFAEKEGADFIATGHYARIEEGENGKMLLRGKDAGKDQSYFLWQLTQKDLARVMFPVGNMEKADVRDAAQRYSLPTAGKRDSQGLCFLGQVDMEEFLSHYAPPKKGEVLNEEGEVIGEQRGAIFYTIGQRGGFTASLGGNVKMPLYVIEKNMGRNTITVGPRPKEAGTASIEITALNEIGRRVPERCSAEFRYRQRPFSVAFKRTAEGRGMLTVLEPGIELPPAGQSCVFYDGDECLGGGIIENIL